MAKVPSTPLDQKDNFLELEEAANKLFLAKKYPKAIVAYDEILELPGLLPENRATVFSNRCSAYLMLKDETSLKMAKFDAESAINVLPDWWKGYFLLADVLIKLQDWCAAEKLLEKAMTLNPRSKEIKDKLSHVRTEIGILSRQDHFHPNYVPLSKEDQIKDICSRMGISEEEIKKREETAMKIPYLSDLLKAERYRDGFGVEKDYAKAAVFYTKAAMNGIPDAMYHLGKMYKYGEGVTQNFEQSLFWLTKAATSKPFSIYKSGVAEAQHALGLLYYEGVGVERDYKKSIEWYEKAVANGFGGSANNLGMLYKHGQGVEKSPIKAFYYFKLAAEQGETSGMQNLADCYFTAFGNGSLKPTDADIAEGMKWLRLAAEKDDGRAVKELQQRESFKNDEIPFDEFAYNLFKSEDYDALNYKKFGKQIKEAAFNGSVTAQRHLNIWKALCESIEAFNKNDPAGLVAALSKAIHLDHQLVEIPEAFKPIIKKRFGTHPNELDTVICYVKINTKNPELVELVQENIKKFTYDEYLWEMYIGTFFTFQGNPAGALQISTMASKRFPGSLVMLYSHAIVLCMQNWQTNETVKALDAFLAAAPNDHRYIPACYYRKSYYYANSGNDPEKLVSCYEEGLAAEKNQLPCYLPYRFPNKIFVQLAYERFKKKKVGIEKAPKNEDAKRFEKVKFDPKRKALLLQNRELFISYAKEYGRAITFPQTAPKPPCTPKPPNWISPKKIMLKDMDPTKDKVYNGRLLEVRIIDWAFKMFSIQTKIEDKNGDVHRFAIYNWPKTGNPKRDTLEAIKTFRPNVKMSIVNPYHRMARDGQNTIRVEGPEFVKLDTSMIDKLCHICGKEAKILPCSKCMMAKYCSKECQKLDWIEFNHKGLCQYLKMYADLM